MVQPTSWKVSGIVHPKMQVNFWALYTGLFLFGGGGGVHLQPVGIFWEAPRTEAAGFAFGAVKEPLMVVPVGSTTRKGSRDPRRMLRPILRTIYVGGGGGHVKLYGGIMLICICIWILLCIYQSVWINVYTQDINQVIPLIPYKTLKKDVYIYIYTNIYICV